MITEYKYSEYEVDKVEKRKWPGEGLGQGFRMFGGKESLTDDFLKKIKKSNRRVLEIRCPNKTTDSYFGVTCKLILVFAKKGSKLNIAVWEPFVDFCATKVGEEPKILFKDLDQLKIVEIHEINSINYARFRDSDGKIVQLQFDKKKLDYTKVVRLHFGKMGKIIADFVNKKK